MPLYDLMLLLDPGAPSDRHQTILRDVQSMLESGGTLVGAHDWGTRRMTFEIDHRPDAAYHLFQFETDAGGALLERVDHSLKIMDGVLRHRLIRLKDGSPPPPMPRPEGRPYGDADAAPAAAGTGAPAAASGTGTPAAADAPASAGAGAEPTEGPAAGGEPVETAAPDASSLPPEAPAEPAAEAPAEPAAEAPAEPAAEAPAEPAAEAPAEPPAEPAGSGDGADGSRSQG